MNTIGRQQATDSAPPITARDFITPRRAHVARMVMRKRRQYVELRDGGLTLNSLWSIVERERASILLQDSPWHMGACSAFEGIYVISLDEALPERTMLLTLGHEWGHALLHFSDPELTRARKDEIERTRALTGIRPWSGRRLPYGPITLAVEEEANLFAAFLLGMSIGAYTAEMDEAAKLVRARRRRAA